MPLSAQRFSPGSAAAWIFHTSPRPPLSILINPALAAVNAARLHEASPNRCGRRRRQLDPKCAAVNAIRFDSNRSAHAFHGFSNNRQADTGAFVRADRIDSLEHSEKTRVVLRLDPDAVVLDAQRYLARFFGGGNFD